MGFEISTIFQIAGLGIMIAIIVAVLKQMNREDYAHWITLAGVVFILFMVIKALADLFQEIKFMFLFQ
jgi:stage III sporulation protein AC